MVLDTEVPWGPMLSVLGLGVEFCHPFALFLFLSAFHPDAQGHEEPQGILCLKVFKGIRISHGLYSFRSMVLPFTGLILLNY